MKMKIILNNEINVIIISIKLLKYSNINYTPTLILQHVIFALKLLQLHPLAQTKKKIENSTLFSSRDPGKQTFKIFNTNMLYIDLIFINLAT